MTKPMTADFVRRCSSEVAGIRCDREDGHRGQHQGAGFGLKARWTTKPPRKKAAS